MKKPQHPTLVEERPTEQRLSRNARQATPKSFDAFVGQLESLPATPRKRLTPLQKRMNSGDL